MHIIPRGQKGDNKFMLISLNQQFPTEPSSTAKFSRSTIRNSHAVPSVHLRHYTRLDSFKHAIWAPFSPLGSFFFWLSNVCTECWKPLCSAVSALFIQLPAGCRVAFISRSELTNADTEIICPVKNSLTRLICGRSPQPLPCRAPLWRIGIISEPMAYAPPLPSLEEGTWFPRVLNPVFQTGLGCCAVPTLPLQGRANPEGHGWDGAGDCFHFPHPGAGSPAPCMVRYGSRDTEQSPIALSPLNLSGLPSRVK